MKIHYKKPIHVQIMEAIEKNEDERGEHRIDYIEVTKAEMDELHFFFGVRPNSLAQVVTFMGVRIVEGA